MHQNDHYRRALEDKQRVPVDFAHRLVRRENTARSSLRRDTHELLATNGFDLPPKSKHMPTLAQMSRSRTPKARLTTPSNLATYPGVTFHHQAVAMNEEVAVCLSNPEKESVRSLRKAMRHLEGQFKLLELLGSLPQQTDQTDAVWVQLKKIRHASGMVRDLDAHLELIHEGHTVQTRLHKDSQDESIHRESKHLLKHLNKRRKREAMKLVHTLRTGQGELRVALENLEHALKPSHGRIVTAKKLAMLIQRWCRVNTTLPCRPRSVSRSKDSHTVDMKANTILEETRLHALRKAAKLCRYMNESLEIDFGTAKRKSIQFKAIQDAGGRWHDLLLLESIAVKRNGKHSELAKLYASRRDAALADYRLRIAALP